MTEPSWDGKSLKLSYYRQDKLSDIHRTFCVLDNEEFQQRQAICEAEKAFRAGDTYENKYFIMKGHKNGNAHIKFKRIDLLDKANQLIAEYYGNSLK